MILTQHRHSQKYNHANKHRDKLINPFVN